MSKKEGFVPATFLTIPCAMKQVILRSTCISCGWKERKMVGAERYSISKSMRINTFW